MRARFEVSTEGIRIATLWSMSHQCPSILNMKGGI